MPNRIKLKGTSERSFDIGLTNKQVFDANGLTTTRVWVLPDSNGSAGYALTTDGSGNLNWSPAVASPAGTDTQVQFNTAGAFDASPDLTFNDTSNTLIVGAASGGSLRIGNNPLVSTSTIIASHQYALGSGISGQNGPNFAFLGADGGTGNTNGGIVQFSAGNGQGTGLGGDVLFQVGSDGSSTAGGKIEFATYGITLDLLNSGAIDINGSTGATGTVLTSQGPSAPPIWTTPGGGGTPGGTDTQVQFNDAGSFGGDSAFTWNKSSDTLTVAGDITSVDSITYDTTATEANAVAKMYWNDGEGTVDVGMKGGNVIAHVGQNLYTLVYNDQGTTLNKGQVVYVYGAQGQRPSVKLALANSDATSARTLGIVAESIGVGAEGFVCIEGDVDNLNTNGLTEGGQLYLSGSTPGGFTQTKPQAPIHLVYLGIVLKASSTAGRVQVKVQNGYELDELHNVLITDPVADNSVLQYQTGTSLWVNSSPSTAINSLLPTQTGNTGTYLTTDGSTASWALLNMASATGTLATTNGGTGIGTYTTGDILYVSSTNTLAKLAAGSSGTVLTISGGVPTWATPSGGGGTPAGSQGSIQFNNAGSFAGTSTMIYDTTSTSFAMTGTAQIDGKIFSPYQTVTPYDYMYNGSGALTTTFNSTTSGTGTDGRAIAIDPEGRFLYTVYNTSNQIAVHSIAYSSALTSVGIYATGTSPIAVEVHPTGKFVYVGNYTANTIQTYSVNQSTGALTSVGTTVSNQGPKSLAATPNGLYLYSGDWVNSAVTCYSINQTTGALTNLGFVAQSGGVESVRVDPTGRYVYALHDGDIYAYKIIQSTGLLISLGLQNAALYTFMQVHPNGKYLYCLTELPNPNNSTINAFQINQNTGAVTAVGTTQTLQISATGMCIDPTGRYIYACNNTSGSVSRLSINQLDGSLSTPTNVAYTTPRNIVAHPNGKYVYMTAATNTIRWGVINNFGAGLADFVSPINIRNATNNITVGLGTGATSIAMGVNPTASGSSAISIGSGTASGTNSISLGTGTAGTANNTINIGSGSAAGLNSINIGSGTSGTSGSIQIGSGTGLGQNTIAIGPNTNVASFSISLQGYSGQTVNGQAAFGVNGTASAESAIAIGGFTRALASTQQAIAIGANAQATGGTSGMIAIGAGSTASANRAIVIGQLSSATGVHSISIGSSVTGGTTAGHTNAISIGSIVNSEFIGQIQIGGIRFSTFSDGSASSLIPYTTTTSNTPTELGLGAGVTDTAPTNRIVCTNYSTYIFDIDIVARAVGSTGVAAWNLKFAFNRNANAASSTISTIAKTVLYTLGTTTGWDVNATADTTNGRPNISVTGSSGVTIRWVGNAKMTKVATAS